MVTSELEIRVSTLETELAKLKKKIGQDIDPEIPWWEKISGSFANDPAFEEAMKLGREYRQSLREDYDVDEDK